MSIRCTRVMTPRTRSLARWGIYGAVILGLALPRPASAFLEDLCTKNAKLQACIKPFAACKEKVDLPTGPARRRWSTSP